MSENLADRQSEEIDAADSIARKILLVDDEPSYRDALGHILTQEKYEVRTASGAKVAIDIAQQFAPDILIVDWMLRDDMDGVEVAESLRAVNPEIRTVFMTGYRTSRLETQMRQVPDSHLLSKPFSLAEFLEVVGAVSCRPAISGEPRGDRPR